MNNFILCFNAIAPLILLMMLGYFLHRIDFIPRSGFESIDKLCFKVFIPVMLFSNIYYADFSTVFHPEAIIFMEAGIAAVFLFSFFLAKKLYKGQNEIAATFVHGVSHGNLAVLGLPLIMNLFGEEQGAVYSVMMACSSPLVNPLMVFEHTYFQGEDIKPGALIVKIFTSPFLAGTLAGLFCKLIGIQFPEFAGTFIADLKSLSSPLCLIALGGTFAFNDAKGYAGPVTLVVVLKCLIIPAIVLGIAVLLGFRGIVLASLLVIFACPSAAATFSFCNGYCGDPAMASQLVMQSSVLSIFTMFLWLFAFLQLGLL